MFQVKIVVSKGAMIASDPWLLSWQLSSLLSDTPHLDLGVSWVMASISDKTMTTVETIMMLEHSSNMFHDFITGLCKTLFIISHYLRISRDEIVETRLECYSNCSSHHNCCCWKYEPLGSVSANIREIFRDLRNCMIEITDAVTWAGLYLILWYQIMCNN